MLTDGVSANGCIVRHPDTMRATPITSDCPFHNPHQDARGEAAENSASSRRGQYVIIDLTPHHAGRTVVFWKGAVCCTVGTVRQASRHASLPTDLPDV